MRTGFRAEGLSAGGELELKMNVECVCNNICLLGEGPVWDVSRQRLYWTDILRRQLWEYCPADGLAQLYWHGDMMVGGLALARDGKMVLCSDRGVYKQADDGSLTKLFHIPFRAGEKFNDITTDPAGRIFAGTLKDDLKDGVLYRLEKGKEITPVLTGIGISNGMTFSMDEKTFFHTDSKAMTIMRYDYNRRSGAISSADLFFQSNEIMGLPDGITIDTEDNLWVAFWGGSCIRQINPHGKIIREVEIPAKQVSSVVFGGRDLRDIYITSACEDGADLERGLDAKGVFLGGFTYRYHSNATGRPEWPADL